MIDFTQLPPANVRNVAIGLWQRVTDFHDAILGT
jgi:hypothetical protein